MDKILIIGSGPAGLTAAYELQKNKYSDIIILEATNHLGGIATTATYHGNHMDMGGHRFFTKSKVVMDLWQELLPLQGRPAKDELILGEVNKKYDGQLDPEKTDDLLLQRRRVSRIYYLKHFFSYPISVTWATFKILGFVRLWQVGWSYLYSMLFKRKENSLEDFYINRFGKELYSMFFENYTEKIWGVHPSKISPEWGAQRVKGLSILGIILSIAKKPFVDKQHVETSLIEEYYYPKFGPGQMWDKLAERIKQQGGKIEFNHEVTKIEKKQDGTFIVTAKTDDGQDTTYLCDKIISTMPICDLIKALPDVPKNIYDVATQLPYRDFITVGLLVKKLLLTNNTDYKTVGNIVPDCWIYVQEHGVKMGRLQIFNNWSPYLVKDLEHTVWIGLEYFCNEGDDFWNMTDEQCIAMATKELQTMGVIGANDVMDSHRERIKKAYPAYFDTYADIDTLIDCLNTYENLYCVGRNGQHRYNNMDHSMLTAIRTAEAIKSGSQADKKAIWNVNTEKEYHE